MLKKKVQLWHNIDEKLGVELSEMLYKICDKEHAILLRPLYCNDNCPIYKNILNDKEKSNSSCSYFKNGTKMLKALRKYNQCCKLIALLKKKEA